MCDNIGLPILWLFILTLRYIIMSLEAIQGGLHQDLVDLELRDWPTSVRSDAKSVLGSITTFDFIIGFAVMHSLLGGLQGITQKLQGRGLDIYEAHKLVNAAAGTLVVS